MKYKNIQTIHETRMWIKDIIMPVIAGIFIVKSNPEMNSKWNEFVCNCKNKMRRIFHK